MPAINGSQDAAEVVLPRAIASVPPPVVGVSAKHGDLVQSGEDWARPRST
jgi:hypothetical protein